MPAKELFERPTPPRPRTPLPSLISNADYPADARKSETQGTAVVVLLVSSIGRVGGCHLQSSSGSASLDRATCELLTTRARFEPARDDKGRPVESAVRVQLEWRLPRRLPITDWSAMILATIGPNGEVASCEEKTQGITRPRGLNCAGLAMMRKAAIQASPEAARIVQSRLVLTTQLIFEDAQVLPPPGAHDKLLTRIAADLTIGEDGEIASCTVTAHEGLLVAIMPPPDCRQVFRGRYERSGEPRRAKAMLNIWTGAGTAETAGDPDSSEGVKSQPHDPDRAGDQQSERDLTGTG